MWLLMRSINTAMFENCEVVDTKDERLNHEGEIAMFEKKMTSIANLSLTPILKGLKHSFTPELLFCRQGTTWYISIVLANKSLMKLHTGPTIESFLLEPEC